MYVSSRKLLFTNINLPTHKQNNNNNNICVYVYVDFIKKKPTAIIKKKTKYKEERRDNKVEQLSAIQTFDKLFYQ